LPGEEISTEGLVLINCSVQFDPHASQGKNQPEIAFE